MPPSLHKIFNGDFGFTDEELMWLDRFVHDYLREGTADLDAAGLAQAFASMGGRLSAEGAERGEGNP